MTEQILLAQEKEAWIIFALTVLVAIILAGYNGWVQPNGGFLFFPGIALGVAGTYRRLRYRLFKKNNS